MSRPGSAPLKAHRTTKDVCEGEQRNRSEALVPNARNGLISAARLENKRPGGGNQPGRTEQGHSQPLFAARTELTRPVDRDNRYVCNGWKAAICHGSPSSSAGARRMNGAAFELKPCRCFAPHGRSG